MGHLNIFTLVLAEGVEYIQVHEIGNEGMYPRSNLSIFLGIYTTISWLTEFYLMRSSKMGINSLVGHPVKLLVRTRTIHPNAFQIIQ